MATGNKATVRVSFGSGSSADAHLSADIPESLNDGKTSFLPGDIVNIAVYKSDNVVLESATSSAGSASIGGQVNVTKTEEIMFEDTNTSSLSTPGQSITSVEWIGRSLGGVTLSGDGTTVVAGSKGVAVANITYVAKATVVALSSPASIGGITSYSILVLIIGNVV